MNKTLIASLLVTSTMFFVTGIAKADPLNYNVEVFCPCTQGDGHTVTNFGSYIGGFGTANMWEENHDVYFKSFSLPTDMPADLTNYSNETATYNAPAGKVSCSYVSSIATEPRFVVSYVLTNGRGGTVLSENEHSVSFTLPIGFSKK